MARRWLGVLLVPGLCGPALAAETIRVSVDSAGQEASGGSSSGASLSASGRYVAFHSDSADLVPDDSDAVNDVFVHDRKKGETTRISAPLPGTNARGDSAGASISANGRYVAFASRAGDLVPGDSASVFNRVYFHDRKTGETVRVTSPVGAAPLDGDSEGVRISARGRHVAFSSRATNLVAGDGNGKQDVFLWDRKTGALERLTDMGGAADGISANGRYVLFDSNASLLPELVDGDPDVFLLDRKKGTIRRASEAADGTEGNAYALSGALSASGRWAAFISAASNLVAGDDAGQDDVFLKDLRRGAIVRVSETPAGEDGDADSSESVAISASGKIVAFDTDASNLVPGDGDTVTDVLVWKRKTRALVRASVDTSGGGPATSCQAPSLAGNGKSVGFHSFSADLVANDQNNATDVFVRDLR